MRRAAIGGSLVVAAIAVLLLGVSAAGAKSSPPKDHGFPVDKYILALINGKLFVGGAPPKILGAKTKDAIYVVDGRAHYQAQLGLRRAGRDNGHGKFLVLNAKTYTSALAYVLGLDPAVAKYVHLFFPQALFTRPFPPLYASITYGFEVAPDSPAPRFEEVPVASERHPDPALGKLGAALVTLKDGLTPGTYLVRVTAKVGLAPHPLKKLYDAYDEASGYAEWLKIALSPAEVALEKVVEKAVDKLIDRAANGDQDALKILQGPAFREKIATKKLKNVVKSALTETSVTAKIQMPTVVPDLTRLNRPRALLKLQERFLRYTWVNDGTASCGRPPGYVKSQDHKAGMKVKVGTRIRVRICTKPAPVPVTPKPTSGGALHWEYQTYVPNPEQATPPAGVEVSLSKNQVVYTFLQAPQAKFTFDVKDGEPPASAAPGATYRFSVTASGTITGGKTVQGYRTADAYLVVDGRVLGPFAGTAQDCHAPIGGAMTCTPDSKATGVATVSFPSAPKRDDTFTFGIGLLNCGPACYGEYRYKAQ